MFKNFITTLIVSFLFFGCTEEIAPDTEALGHNYYPLRIGEFWIYKVTEVKFKNQFEKEGHDSISYYVREQIDTIYQDLTQEDTYKFTRSRRSSLTENWGTDSVFTVNKSVGSVRLYQNNRRIVPFIFPVLENKKWNAHIFNTQSSFDNKSEEKFYYFANVDKPVTVNGTLFPKTVTVVQVKNENAIERQDWYEVYASGTGRIYKHLLTFDYCSDPGRQNGCEVGQAFIISGTKRTEKLLEHGIIK